MNSDQVGVSEVTENSESPCHSQLVDGSSVEIVGASPQTLLVVASLKTSHDVPRGQEVMSRQDLMQPKELNEGKEAPSLQLPKEHSNQRNCSENPKVPGGQYMNDKTDKKDDVSLCEKKTSVKKSVVRSKNNEKQQGKNCIEEGKANLEQQNLIEESGKMMEYLRQEVLRLRSDNVSLRNELDTMTDNTKRLTEANSAARASFAALNEHAVVQRDNALTASENYEKQIQELRMSQQEMKDELRMKHNAYISEFRTRLNYEEAMGRIIDALQERCRDSQLVEDILQITDELEEQKHEGEEEDVLDVSVHGKTNEQSNIVGRLTSFFS